MILIIGLGNPGEKYGNNRHNAGFIILDELKNDWDFPAFEFSHKFNSEISEKNKDSDKIILAKPQTFMNNSGETVQKIMSFYKLTPENIIVIHDDLDINFGEYKISTDSGPAGHNGVQDIIDKIGTQNFKRIRIGIEGEEKRKARIIPGDVFVLQDFSQEELEIIKNLAKEIKL
ncbi:MAG: aminoacyl-tRNA hydrolase [Parcubacteria group bacterium]|jgi:PTH1 family peptidyl-tRNA hydrolase